MKTLLWFPAEHEAEARLAIIDSARTVLWRSLIVVFAAEFSVMLLLRSLRGLPFGIGISLLDGLLLSVFALPALYLVILRPVTLLVAEQVAVSAESHFKTIARTVRDGIVIFDRERKIKFVNPAIEKTFGYAPNALLGLDVKVLLPKNVADLFQEGIERYRATGEDPIIGKGPVEFEGRRTDGEQFTVELLVDAIRTKTDLHFIVVIRDITERKHAEEALRENERTLRQIFEALPVAVRIVHEGKIVFANPADARLHGYGSPNEEMGTDASAFVVEENWDKLPGHAQGSVAESELPSNYEAHAKRRDGTVFHVDVTTNPIPHGDSPANLVITRDLTERDRLHLYEQILPVCCVCGRIRDDTGVEHGNGAWGRLEQYVVRHSNAHVSHGICPDCEPAYRKKMGLS